ncbi:MAG: hypothetical protein LLG20_17480 [Acidobacteriales bacterium]|nr:hypothetical protein [Terriglobales bacterium]
MTDSEIHSKRDRDAIADVWRRTLSQIPTQFGRLAYFAGLCNPNTGIYEHHGLAALFGDEASRTALVESHAETFAAWLAMPLERQKADLDAYLSGLDEDKTSVVRNWLSSHSYQNLMPALARETAKALFMSDMEALVGILKCEYGVVYPDPDA